MPIKVASNFKITWIKHCLTLFKYLLSWRKFFPSSLYWEASLWTLLGSEFKTLDIYFTHHELVIYKQEVQIMFAGHERADRGIWGLPRLVLPYWRIIIVVDLLKPTVAKTMFLAKGKLFLPFFLPSTSLPIGRISLGVLGSSTSCIKLLYIIFRELKSYTLEASDSVCVSFLAYSNVQ